MFGSFSLQPLFEGCYNDDLKIWEELILNGHSSEGNLIDDLKEVLEDAKFTSDEIDEFEDALNDYLEACQKRARFVKNKGTTPEQTRANRERYIQKSR